MNKQQSASPVRLTTNPHLVNAVLFIFQDTALNTLILGTMERREFERKKSKTTTVKKRMTKITQFPELEVSVTHRVYKDLSTMPSVLKIS